jgi:2-methylisocitrate lyase-like PEP mutase family enzyme
LANTIARLQAYQEAGADVLYAPGLTRADDIRSVVQSVDRPLNVLAGVGNAALNHGQLSDLGVKRISVGSAIARAAYGLTITAGIEMRDLGTFQFAGAAIGYSEISAKFPSG